MAVKRILIVDDDIELCEELAESLGDEGYAPEFTRDAVEGENLIRDGSYDIIILDYKMPLITGIDILKKLKKAKIRKHIFIMTGRPFVELALKEENLSDMVSGIISKPLNFEVLLQKIKSA